MDDYGGDYYDPRSLADEIRRPGQWETPKEIRERAALEADPVRRAQEEERLRALQSRTAWESQKQAARRRELVKRAGVLRRMVEDELAPLVDAVRNNRFVDEPLVDQAVRRLAARSGIAEARLRPVVEGALARADGGFGLTARQVRELLEGFVGEQVEAGWIPPDGEEELDPHALAAAIPRRPTFAPAPAPGREA